MSHKLEPPEMDWFYGDTPRKGGKALPCIVCGKRLDGYFDGEQNHPGHGVACSTHGNYGSTIFDEIDGHYLEFNVCDDCLIKASERGHVALGFISDLACILVRWEPGLEDKYPSANERERARQRQAWLKQTFEQAQKNADQS